MSSNPLRQYFPAFSNPLNNDWVYLDSGATTQKLKTVIDITEQYYQRSVNVHRSSYQEAADTTQKFEESRRVIQRFINAKDHKEIVWTKGATESINLLATCIQKSFLKAGQDIVISALEHHANIVPWQLVAAQLGLNLKVMPVDNNGVLKLKESLTLIDANTALVTIGHVSNALGNINPIESIIEQAKQVGALTVVDGTQAVSHITVDVQKLGCDFYVFSGHKMFGPTGIGVLYGKLGLLEQMPPYQTGGEMIKKVSFQKTSFQAPPLKFEAGTPNVAGVLGLGLAANFIEDNRIRLQQQESQLELYLQQALASIPEVKVWGDVKNKISTSSFTVEGVTHYDLASYLNSKNIAIRVGHHCAMPLMETLGIVGTLRVSISCYNTEEDLSKFVSALKDGIRLFTQPNSENKDNVNLVTGELAQMITEAKSWDEKYRHIMLAGKDLPRLTEQHKNADSEVAGCESQVWLKCWVVDSILVIQGDSPSKIVRGLLAIIFEALKGKTPVNVLAFDLDTYLTSIGLARYLSDSRANGVKAVVDKILDFSRTKIIN